MGTGGQQIINCLNVAAMLTPAARGDRLDSKSGPGHSRLGSHDLEGEPERIWIYSAERPDPHNNRQDSPADLGPCQLVFGHRQEILDQT